MELKIGAPIEVVLHGIAEKGELVEYLSDTEIRIKLEKDSLPNNPNHVNVDLEKYPVTIDKGRFVISILNDL